MVVELSIAGGGEHMAKMIRARMDCLDRPHNAAITSLQFVMRGAPHNNAMNADHGILPCGSQGG